DLLAGGDAQLEAGLALAVARLGHDLRGELGPLAREHLEHARHRPRLRRPADLLALAAGVFDHLARADAVVQVRIDRELDVLVLALGVLDDVDVADVTALLIDVDPARDGV